MLPDFRFEKAWLRYYREDLSRRYGVGTFVAVYDGAVIEWGKDPNEVREGAVKALQEPVFVSGIPTELFPENDCEVNAE